MTYNVILEWDSESNVWVTYVPELGGISTFGETEQEAMDMTRDMIKGHLQAFGNEPSETPPRAPRILQLAM